MSTLGDLALSPTELAAKDAAKHARAAIAMGPPPGSGAESEAAPAPAPEAIPTTPHLIRETTTGQHLVEDGDGSIFLKDSFGTVRKFAPKEAGAELASNSVWKAAAPEDVKSHLDKQAWDDASLNAKGDWAARKFITSVADLATTPVRLGAKLFGADPSLTQKLSGENIVRKLDEALEGTPLVAEGASAAAEEEGARQLERGAPTAARLGVDVAGLVAGGGLAKGAAGLVGKLGAGAALGADALTLEGMGARVGQGATKIAETLGVSAERAAKLGAYADTVAQGAALGNSQAAHEAWVNNEALTSEAQWHGIGMGALLGLGGHAAIDAAGGLTKAAAERVFGKSLKAGVVASDQAAQELVEGVSGVKQPEGTGGLVKKHLDWVEDKLSEMQAAKTGTPLEKIKAYKANAAEIEELAANRDKIFDKGTKDLTESLKELHGEGSAIHEEVRNVAMKREHMARLLEGSDAAPIMQLAKDKAAELQGAYEQLGAKQGRGRVVLGGGKQIADIKGAYEDAIDGLAAAKAPADVTSVLDQFKRAADRAKVNAEQSASKVTSGIERNQAFARMELMRDVANNTRSLLEDTGLFGKFGEAQRESNAAWTRKLDSEKLVREELFRRTGQISGGADYGATRWEIDPKKVESYLNGLGTNRSTLVDGYIRDNIEASKSLAETLGKYYNTSEHTASIETAKRAATSAQETLGHLDKTLRAMNLRDEVMAKEAAANGHGSDGIALAAMLGHMLGGPVGTGAAIALKAANKVLSNPGSFTRQMLGMRASAEQLSTSISKNISRALDSTAPVRGAARLVAIKEGSEAYAKRYDSTATRVAELASNPQAAIDAVANVTSHIEHPGVQQGVITTSLSALNFLASKLPPPLYQDSVSKKSQLNNVSNTSRDTFMRYSAAVDKPGDFFKALGDGSATQEQAETAQALMPQAFALAQQAAIMQFGSGKVKASYQVRLNVQRMLQIQVQPTANPSLQPFISQSTQQAGAAQQQAPKPSGSSGAPSAATNLSNQSLSNLKV